MKCEVAVHFNSTSHSLQDFSFQCIDQINDTNRQDDIDRLLITKEAYWSAQLFTLAPHGLNKRQEFHSKNRIHFNSTWFIDARFLIKNLIFQVFQPFKGFCWGNLLFHRKLNSLAQRRQSGNLLWLLCIVRGFRFSLSSCFYIGSFTVLFAFLFSYNLRKVIPLGIFTSLMNFNQVVKYAGTSLSTLFNLLLCPFYCTF